MRHQFQGWAVVGQKLLSRLENETSDERLNEGQRASIRLAAQRLQENGLVIADEVGMGKTRIAVELARAVVEAGGRVAILSFHSGEDRRVKKSFQSLFRAGVYSEVAPDPIRPSVEESASNPRARSAKLRWAIRL